MRAMLLFSVSLGFAIVSVLVVNATTSGRGQRDAGQSSSQVSLTTVLPADGTSLAAAGVRPEDISAMRTRLNGAEAGTLATARQSSLDQITLASQQARSAEMRLARNPFDQEARATLATARAARRTALASFNQHQDDLRSLALDAVSPEVSARVMACSINASKGLDGADVALTWSPDRARELVEARRVEARCERHGEDVPAENASLIQDAESNFGRNEAGISINVHAAEIDRLLRQ